MEDSFDTVRFHFMKALDIDDTDERVAYVNKVAGEKNGVGERLKQMLEAHQQASKVEEESSDRDPVEIDAQVLDDRFTILEKIGEGGFGNVYLVQQHKPLQRKVALKVLKPGMDSKEIIGRFRLEQSAMALMDHPLIAKILDSGTTADKRPYFVMVYLEGTRITRYCDDHRLGIPQRLELFTQICDAVQHAHQNGVIHRDLKPSNLLVVEIDGEPQPKVIDFGVAKALNPTLKGVSLPTQHFHLIGSTRYMSPEQAGFRGLPIDTRSDVYSLGVVLYQLLAGVTPLTKSSTSSNEHSAVLELLRNEDAPLMSSRFAKLSESKQRKLARNRGLTTQAMARLLKGELSSIVGMAIEREPNERYQTVGDMGNDIRRFLRDEPIMAKTATSAYLLRKTLRRHRKTVAFVLLLMFSIVAGLFFSLVQLRRAWDAERTTDLQLAAITILQKRTENALNDAVTARENLKDLVYTGDVRVASQELNAGDLSAAAELLNRHRPANPNNVSGDRRGVEWYFLSRVYHRDPTLLQKADDGFSFAGFLRGTDYFVTANYDGRIYLFDAETEELVREIPGHGFGNMVNWADVSPNGELLASAGDDGRVRIWDLTGQGREKSIEVGMPVFRVFFNSAGDELITSCDEKSVRFWDLESGKQVRQLTDFETEVKGRMTVRRSAKGDKIIASRTTFNICRYDAKTFKRALTYKSHGSGGIRCLGVSDDGKMVAGGFYNYDIRVWNADAEETTHHFQGHRDDVQSVAFHPSGKVLVSSDRAGVVRFWNLEDGITQTKTPEYREWPPVLISNQDRVWAVDFSNDGKKIVTACRDHTTKIWRANEPKILDVNGGIVDVRLCWKDSSELISSCRESLHLWNIDTGSKMYQTVFPVKICSMTTIGVPDQLVVGLQTGQIRVLDIDSFQELDGWLGHPAEGPVYSVDVSADGNRLVSTGGDQRFGIFDLQTGKLEFEKEEDRNFRKAIFLSDPRFAALAYEDDVKIWNLESKRFERVLKGHTSTVSTLIELPEQGMLVSGSHDRTIRTWDYRTGKELNVIKCHDDKIRSMTISNDGKSLITGDASGGIAFSHWRTGRFLGRFDMLNFWTKKQSSLPLEISDLAMSPDGKHLAVAVSRRGIVVLDVAE